MVYRIEYGPGGLRQTLPGIPRAEVMRHYDAMVRDGHVAVRLLSPLGEPIDAEALRREIARDGG